MRPRSVHLRSTLAALAAYTGTATTLIVGAAACGQSPAGATDDGKQDPDSESPQGGTAHTPPQHGPSDNDPDGKPEGGNPGQGGDPQSPPEGGSAEPEPLHPVVDLRADVNRDGTVSLTDATEDTDEDTWSAQQGAVFLANIDDDEAQCDPNEEDDSALAACNDAADSVINGSADLLDLARLKTAPWTDAPDGAYATFKLDSASKSKVRLFKKKGSNFKAFDPSKDQLTADELRTGVELALEGKDIVRDVSVWDGSAKLTYTVIVDDADHDQEVMGSDVLELRIAPLLFRHHLDPVTRAYVASFNSDSSIAFRNDLRSAVNDANVPEGLMEITGLGDQWTQDYFETAYTKMPRPGDGKDQVLHVNVRSANYTGELRWAGRVVFSHLRGKDVGGVVAYDPSHSNGMDSLNSFGNFETIPPYSLGSKTYPFGRVLRGSVANFHPDEVFDRMVESQGFQPMLTVDTSWLLVGHVDETISFIKTNSARGWAMVVNDPQMAIDLLMQLVADGYGEETMFKGKFWDSAEDFPAEVKLASITEDAQFMAENQQVALNIEDQIAIIKAATGLKDDEIIRIPYLHYEDQGYSVAYQPGMVNGIYLSDSDFGAPDPHGPAIEGVDPFKFSMESAFASHGVNVHWIEDWNLYHRLSGEVHCGSNVTRAVPANLDWWTQSL